jgi:hypothetical protein
MKLAFTLCSNNYLAQAKILADSLISHNPDYTFIIGLVDEKSDLIDYNFFSPHTIIPIADIGIENFDELWKKYNIIELNTSVKASFFKYLQAENPAVEFIFYFDPDIMVFHKLHLLEGEFQRADILLTPHVLSPIPLDGLLPSENTFLNYGTYNLGFIGVKTATANTTRMLDWWEERTLTMGYINEAKGIFVDQLWMNHVPLFFQNVKVLKGYGYNTAPWNLQERRSITREQAGYKMEDGGFLVFFHFSTYNYLLPDQLSKYNRNNFQNTPDVKPLYEVYHHLLQQNNVAKLSVIPCAYVERRRAYFLSQHFQRSKQPRFIRAIKKAGRLVAPPLLITLAKKYRVFK